MSLASKPPPLPSRLFSQLVLGHVVPHRLDLVQPLLPLVLPVVVDDLVELLLPLNARGLRSDNDDGQTNITIREVIRSEREEGGR